MSALQTYTLSPDTSEHIHAVCGPMDRHVRLLEEHLCVKVYRRGAHIRLQSEKEEAAGLAVRAFSRLETHLKDYGRLNEEDVGQILARLSEETVKTNGGVIHTPRLKVLSKTPAQAHYQATMREKVLTFGMGPAGSGKSYLAVALAVEHLITARVERIILTRPLIEAGEQMGFLPGDMQEKVDPYLRPLYDALDAFVGSETTLRWIAQGKIEMAPLAFMRGRTLSRAFVILDEAQNTTCEQMKMFLTRIGFNTKVVVTGDPLQSDLPTQRISGLRDALSRLSEDEYIGIVPLSKADIVRHPLVARIVGAYEQDADK